MLDFDSNALYEVLKDVCDLTNTTITLYDDNKNSLFSYEPPPPPVYPLSKNTHYQSDFRQMQPL